MFELNLIKIVCYMLINIFWLTCNFDFLNEKSTIYVVIGIGLLLIQFSINSYVIRKYIKTKKGETSE